LKIAIAGAGYVGLTTAVCFASAGHQVVCVENDKEKLLTLQSGRSPIFEAGILEMLLANKERLTFTCDKSFAYKDPEAVFICVGTPERGDGNANLKYVYQAAEEILTSLCQDAVLVVKSTVPAGTNERLERLISKKSLPFQVEVASNPEFLSQGTAVSDMLHGPRIVIGTNSKKSESVLRRVYENFSSPIVATDRKSAEMIKYASNNFLALKISFINEIANLCELIGADIGDVARGMGMDPRIGEKFLKSGIGYGGSCFPKDTKALHWLARFHNYELKTVKAAIEVNENQKLRLLKKARKYYKSLEGLKVAVLGLSFKPGTDDLRDAPSLQVLPILLDDGARVFVFDPAAAKNFKALYENEVVYCQSIEEAVRDADLCLILTEWEEIKAFPLSGYRLLMRRPIVLDGRNCYEVTDAAKEKICYDSIGRKFAGHFKTAPEDNFG